MELTKWLGHVLHGWIQLLLFDSHVSFGSRFHKHFCGRCWRMTLVNSPLAVVGCVPANAIKDTTWKVAVVSLPLPGLTPGLTSENLTSPYLWDEQWPGLGLCSLASSRLLWAKQSSDSIQLTLVTCPGIFTPALVLLESFLKGSYFIFLILFKIFTPRISNGP